MKLNEIQVGKYYHDAKDGVREVLAIEGQPLRVRYKLLAAKQTQEYDYKTRAMKSLIGGVTIVSLEAFAAWAKSVHDQGSIDDVLLALEAKRVKLSPGEKAFVRSALDAAEGKLEAGKRVGIDHTEGRAVAGLVKKGVVHRFGSEAEFTRLGAACAQAAKAVTT